MKKGCAIAFAAVLVLVGVPGAILFGKVNEQYGITASPAISHETLARSDTGLRVAVEPSHARDLAVALIPPDIQMPPWLPFDFETALDQVMPREVALLVTPDYAERQLEITLFLNERRLGPQLVTALNAQGPMVVPPAVRWDKQGFVMAQRGRITTQGTLALPEGFENELLRRWSPRRRPVTTRAEGGHLIEAVLDNRHGDAFLLWATIIDMGGGDWRQIMEDSRSQQALEVLVYVDEIRMTADLVNKDTLKVQIRVDIEPTMGENLVTVFNWPVPAVQATIQSRYNIVMEGAFAWDGGKKALLGDFTFTGIFAELERQRDLILAAQKADTSSQE